MWYLYYLVHLMAKLKSFEDYILQNIQLGGLSLSSEILPSNWTLENNTFMEEVVEGDILLPPASLSGNGLKDKSRLWTDKIIPYEISSNIAGRDRWMIYEAIRDFHEFTCLTFVRRTPYDKDYVYITNQKSGCFSKPGRIGGKQIINLETPGCTTEKGSILHEMLHCIGFHHEHNRPDRDKYVTINFDNIERGKESDFEKVQPDEVDNLGIAYDYCSVMHYSKFTFSKNGLPTIEPKVKVINLGQTAGLSEKDILKLNKLYDCPEDEYNIEELEFALPAIANESSSQVYTIRCE